MNSLSSQVQATAARYPSRYKPAYLESGLLLALLLALSIAPCYATSHFVDSQIRLSHIQRHTESMLSDAEIRISGFLTQSERQIQRQATIKVPASYALIAQAYPGNIEISSGTFWVLEQLTMAHIADRQLGYAGCEEDYTDYIADGIMQHSGGGKKARFSFDQLPLTAYAAAFGGDCTGFHPSEIREQGAKDYFIRLMQASMTLIYLHELGHHVLGHVERMPADSTRARTYEAAADAWAIEAAFRSGFNVLEGVPALNLIAALGANAETRQTHPLGIRRVRDMMHRALDILAKQGKDEVVAWLTDSLRHTERKLNVDQFDTD